MVLLSANPVSTVTQHEKYLNVLSLTPAVVITYLVEVVLGPVNILVHNEVNGMPIVKYMPCRIYTATLIVSVDRGNGKYGSSSFTVPLDISHAELRDSWSHDFPKS